MSLKTSPLRRWRSQEVTSTSIVWHVQLPTLTFSLQCPFNSR